MHLSEIARRTVLSAALVMGLAILAAGCESGPSPAPTLTPEPGLSLDELLQSGGEKLAAVTTAKFTMVDETESGKKFFGNDLKTVSGEIRPPDGVELQVDVQHPAFGFVQMGIVAVQEQAYMRFSEDALWLPIPLDQVPFNFAAIGVVLSDLLDIMENTAIVGSESVGEFDTIRVDGNVMSEDMSALISDVNPGHPLTLSYWFDEADHTLRQFRIDGQLYDEDAPETSRLVNMELNVPVDIELPEIAS